ncbi:alpha/beta hydrolase [Streptomyces sp. NBC_01565]|uniref:alpha/beta hydrolase family protein n=1 Tax=unclassified Streptomyces TaxID=2593676 RepID=UPI00224DE26D|nr:alpha/beta hydrolase [Streptomyces sp. NBC_01565]MCX4545735.1 alpha/beta hydrolase [Streptomyces sp. NBC_01565]
MRRLLLVGAAVATALAGTFSTATAHAAAPPAVTLVLPEPSGQQPVGRVTVHLKDEGRPDPWVPSEDRELMVSLWYPAVGSSGTPAPYMTREESERYVEANQLGVPGDLFTTVATHASAGAKPAKARGGLPLVILSPGFGMPRATLTGLAEELAGRGYAVAGIGHNYEADGISFPDGHTTSCVACADRDYPKVGAVRAADVSFVIDELTGKRPAWKGGAPIDADRIAVVGHSAGGFSIVPAMLGDPRVKAGVNMDGNFRFPNDTPLDRPVLMLGQPGHVPGGERSWDETWTELTGWKRWLSVDDTDHLSFTDLAPLAKQLGRPLQRLDGDRVDAITRAYVAAFVDTHLRGRNTPLLDGPTARFPEVRFHRP